MHQVSELGVGQGRVIDPNVIGQDLVLKHFKYGDEKRKVEAWFKTAAKDSSATVTKPMPAAGGSINPLRSGGSSGGGGAGDGEEAVSTNPLRAGRGRGRGRGGRGRGRGR
jgi:hypothetical protein